MENNTINFLSDWQLSFAFGLGKVIFTEKDSNNKTLRKIIMSTNQFNNIVDYHWEKFRSLNTNSLLYKYFDRDYVGENEEWAVYSEVLIENIHEFLNHLTTIDKKNEELNLVRKEYEYLMKFCEECIKNKSKIYFLADNY